MIVLKVQRKMKKVIFSTKKSPAEYTAGLLKSMRLLKVIALMKII